jgi:hypothetical protein
VYRSPSGGLACTALHQKNKTLQKQPKGILILYSSGLLVDTGPRPILRSACVALVLGAQQKTYVHSSKLSPPPQATRQDRVLGSAPVINSLLQWRQ